MLRTLQHFIKQILTDNKCFKWRFRARYCQGNRKLLIIICVINVNRYSNNTAYHVKLTRTNSVITALTLSSIFLIKCNLTVCCAYSCFRFICFGHYPHFLITNYLPVCLRKTTSMFFNIVCIFKYVFSYICKLFIINMLMWLILLYFYNICMLIYTAIHCNNVLAMTIYMFMPNKMNQIENEFELL